MTDLPFCEGLPILFCFQQGAQIPSSAQTSGVLTGLHLATGVWMVCFRPLRGPERAQPQALVKWDLDHDEKLALLFLLLFVPLFPMQVCSPQ